jgi:CBS domain-containing protein
MIVPIRSFIALTFFSLLSRAVSAADIEPPAPVLEWSFYVLLIFAFCVVAFVFFAKRGDRNKMALSSVIDDSRRPIASVHPDTSVTECIRMMNSENIGAVLVMQEDALTGIFTERDALNKVLAEGIDPATTKVAEVMTRDPYFVDPSTTVEEAMAVVTHHKIRHLPIVHNGRVVGIVSSGDLTHWLVEDQAGEIRELVDVAARRRRQ